jgi:hypothetical protein
MTIQYEITDLGFSTADAEQVQLEFNGCNLSIRFIDWQEQPKTHIFIEVLGFSWNDELDNPSIRDDVTYIVSDSDWLRSQCELSNEEVEQYIHYKLCFNACGVLDVICKR